MLIPVTQFSINGTFFSEWVTFRIIPLVVVGVRADIIERHVPHEALHMYVLLRDMFLMKHYIRITERHVPHEALHTYY